MQGDSRRTRRGRLARSRNPAMQPWFQLPPAVDRHGAVVVVGAGLAGCSVARALAERGREVVLFERGDAVASGASGNPVGVAKPFVTRAPSVADDFHRAAFSELQDWLNHATWLAGTGFKRIGAVQLTEGIYPTSDRYELVDAATASIRAGRELPSGGLFFAAAGFLDPSAFCRAAVAHPRVDLRLASDIEVHANNGGWEIVDQHGLSTHARTVILASGTGLTQTPWTDTLPMIPARGQISRFACQQSAILPTCVVAGKHYAIPNDDTLYVGASFDRHDTGTDLREPDHLANLAGLGALLPGLDTVPEALSGHVGVRATTPDRMPFVGPVPDTRQCSEVYHDLARGLPASSYAPLPVVPGLAVLGGFGSRGIVLAPYTARLMVDWLCGGDELQAWMPLLSPVRFQIRALRRATLDA